MRAHGQQQAALMGQRRSVTVRLLDTDWEYRQQQSASRLERKIRRHALEYERTLHGENAHLGQSTERLKDITDFDFRFRHRHLLSNQSRERLEIIAAKLSWRKKDGRPGFFARMEQNEFDWKSHASVIASIRGQWPDSVIRCGIWTQGNTKKRNSGRCHNQDLCPLCLWIDHLKLIEESFGPESGAFARGKHWFNMHLSVRASRANSCAVGRGLTDEDWDIENTDGMYSELYESRPVGLSASLDHDVAEGIQTCRFAFLAVQKALNAAYAKGKGILGGYRQKLEVGLSLPPTHALPHGHSVGNGHDENPQYIADLLYEEMDKVLQHYRDELTIPLYPSVRVFSIPSSDDLLRCLKYLEKIIPLNLIVRIAQHQPGAKNPDDTWSVEFLDILETDLLELHDQLCDLHGKFRAFDEFYWLQRRRSLGNMRYGHHFIGMEPDWHAAKRDYIRQQQAARRQRVKLRKEQEEGEAADGDPNIDGTVEEADYEF
jgi:hypothetical protein